MDHVLFPRFWIEEPALWFAQVEAVFALNNITADTDKYDYILCELPSTVISLIKDLILDSTNDFQDGKYQNIKKQLIKRITIAELKKEEIGTQKPSEFYTHLKRKADKFVPEEILKEIWLKKLPLQVNYIVSDMKGDMESVCILADTVKEYIPVAYCNCNLTRTPEATSSTGDVSKLLKNLGTQLENIQTEFLKFKLFNRTNNSHLESIQAELHKFKMTYDDNNIRLENIQSELKKIKSAYCTKNNNDKVQCKICKEDKSMNNYSGDDKSNHNSEHDKSKSNNNSDESNANNDSENDEPVNEDEDEMPINSGEAEKPIDSGETAVDAFCWYHKFYGDNAHNCLAPCNYKEKKGQVAVSGNST